MRNFDEKYFKINFRAYEARTGQVVSGFISISIFSFANFFAAFLTPVFISIFGRKTTMIMGGLLEEQFEKFRKQCFQKFHFILANSDQASYFFTYLNPSPNLYYVFSAIAGLGDSLLWVSVMTEVGLITSKKCIFSKPSFQKN